MPSPRLNHRVLVLSPYAPTSARGNAATARRTAARLESCGATTQIVESNPELVTKAIVEFKPDVLHGVHVGHTLRGLGGDTARLPKLPLVLTLGGNDLFEDLGVAPNSSATGETKPDSIALVQVAAAVIVATQSQLLTASNLRGSSDRVLLSPRCPEIGFEPVPTLQELIKAARHTQTPASTGQESAPSIARAKPGRPIENPVITWSGALRHQKRPEWILPIHRELRRQFPSLVTIVAGPFPRNNAEHSLAAKLAAEPGIAMLPPFPPGGPGIGATGTLLKATDVVLNTSRTEGKSNFVLEAIAESTPVVASNTPGNQDWLKGLATLFDTTNEASHAIASLISNESEARKLATLALACLDFDAAKEAEKSALSTAHAIAVCPEQ